MCNISVLVLSERIKPNIFSNIKYPACHVLLGRPFENSMSKKNTMYIDILSNNGNSETCIFTKSIKIENIISCISETVKKKHLQVILFEDFQSLLNYHHNYTLLQMVNSIKITDELKDIKKMFLLTIEKDHLETEAISLSEDLKLFADEFKELS